MSFRTESLLLIIDVQGRLAEAMWRRDLLLDRLGRLSSGARALGMPIVCTEQVPEKLGPTVPELVQRLAGTERWPKRTFSCWRDRRIAEHIETHQRPCIWLAGIESHVCVYQTAADLLRAGYRVEAIADAISSRTEEDRQAGMDRMRAMGAGLMTVEMALFEALETAEGDDFRAIHKIVK
mgnify:CR=1 FL=1